MRTSNTFGLLASRLCSHNVNVHHCRSCCRTKFANNQKKSWLIAAKKLGCRVEAVHDPRTGHIDHVARRSGQVYGVFHEFTSPLERKASNGVLSTKAL
jgi:hypothetical protein